MNNRSIPSMHAERKITNLSVKHSFTPYPSLSPYSQTDRMTDRGTNTLTARGLEELFFPVVVLCQFLVLAGNKFWFYILMYLEYNTVVVLLVFWFWQEIVFGVTYVLSVQYSCAVVSDFWVVAGNRSQNEDRFYKKILLGYFIMIR